jgi:23S rRNA (uridine2552-2'-O)-methyltransferase
MDSGLEIVAVDLIRMEPIERVTFIQGNILDLGILDQIKAATRGSIDMVISDCAPKVSGNWDLDVFRQLSLAEGTLDIGLKLLDAKGKVLTKVFQGSGFQEFLQATRKKYRSVKLVKPAASRQSSAEIYLLAIGPTGQPDDEIED